jgi:TonB family protein
MKRNAIMTVILLASAASVFAQADIEPARFIRGSIPQMPPLAAAGGDVALSVAVSPAGAVGAVDVLRSTPPFTDAVVAAVRTWKFSPALDGNRTPMNTRVLVDAVVGAPSLNVPTVGTPPKDVSADTRVPFPATTAAAAYPVNARAEGTVLVETRVDPTGHVVGVTAVRSAPPFDAVAMDAVRSWTFRPAQGADAPPSTYAYVLFVFRQPVVGASATATKKP